MTISLALTPELERRLKQAAEQQGLPALSLPTSFVVAKRRQRLAAGVSPQIMMVQTVPSREAAAAGR